MTSALTFLFVFYCFEAGVFFAVIPWTPIWSLNVLLHATPAIGALSDNPYLKGLISGFGIVHLMLGTSEVLHYLRNRQRSSPSVRDERHQ